MPVTFTYTPATATSVAFFTGIGTDASEPIFGTEISDIMFGLGGNDYLFGSDSNDGLDGGAGSDILTGGRGSDVFFFRSAAEANGDVIADFRREEGDIIDVSSIDASSSIAGDQAFTWIGTASFTAVGQLGYAQLSGSTFILGNTGGDLNPDFLIGVVGLVNFVPSDFAL